MAEEIEVNYDDLESDANLWGDIAGEVKAAGQIVSGLAVERSAFSFLGGDVADLYKKACKQVEELLEAGEKELNKGSAVLRAVRADYERADEEVRELLDTSGSRLG